MGRMRSKSMTRFRSGCFFDTLGKYAMASLCLSWAGSPASFFAFTASSVPAAGTD
jgi:hypothetical protein